MLRHVSPAFVEDPVRILRVARFAARFATLGFTVAPQTTRADARRGRAAAKSTRWCPSACGAKLQRALGEANPEVFFDTLKECGALTAVLPELAWNEPRTQLAAACSRYHTRAHSPIRSAADGSYAIGRRCIVRTPARAERISRSGATYQRASPQPAGRSAGSRRSCCTLFERSDAFRRPERFEQVAAGRADTGRYRQRNLDRHWRQREAQRCRKNR